VQAKNLRYIRQPAFSYRLQCSPGLPMTPLRTERLTLRALAFADAPHLLPALRDATNMHYWSRGPIATEEEVREYISYNVEGEGVQCFAITESPRVEAALG